MKKYCSHCGARLAKEIIPGGKAEGMSAEDIAKKHNVPVEEIKRQLDIGEKIEMEHTKNKAMAREIARDHVEEFPDYYDPYLKEMEEKAKKKHEE